jgi:hypothetical protein
LRVKRVQELLHNSDAGEVLIGASKADTAVSDLSKDVALAIMSVVLKTLNALEKDPDIKPRACMDLANTASFALQNTANACHRLGITSLPESLKKIAGMFPDAVNGRGDWTPGLVQQINVTVQQMKEAARAASSPAGVAGSGPATDSPAVEVETVLDKPAKRAK